MKELVTVIMNIEISFLITRKKKESQKKGLTIICKEIECMVLSKRVQGVSYIMRMSKSSWHKFKSYVLTVKDDIEF